MPVSTAAPVLTPNKLVLASGSSIRRHLLEAAGVPVAAYPVDIDEEHLRHQAQHDGLSLKETALFLARAKAQEASTRLSKALPSPQTSTFILAADQILDLDGTAFAKPTSLQEARTHLSLLRNKTHALHTSLTLWKDGQEYWHHTSSPTLTMRHFSDSFLEHYLQQEGQAILSCVGCYRIEALGLQLFDHVCGSSDAIAGLPLLPLLTALRKSGFLPS